MDGKKLGYNLIALLTVGVWGTTFVSTKLLLNQGMTPQGIFLSRFAIAYICILVFSHRRLWCDTLSDELLMAAMGLTGGSIYFIAENSALTFTFASNVSLIICTTPIFTMILGHLVYGDKIKPVAVAGSVGAFAGVAIVVFNGTMNFNINPLGDFLSLIASLLWAIYCILLKKVNGRYPNLFMTRKIFFYGVASAMLLYLWSPSRIIPEDADMTLLWGNLMFLGVLASFLCYLSWNVAVKALGPEKAANYIYFNPLVTVIASAMILGEPITAATVAGAAFIIAGVFLTSR